MTIEESISLLVQRRDLTQDQAAEVMRAFMTGGATPAQMAGFLVALSMKGETIPEITGFAMTMRELATCVPTSRRPLVDTCGTGGAHSGTINISTTAAFVVAGAGVAVAKHGNRATTRKSGSADVLEALGVCIDAGPERIGACIDEIGIGFLFARSLHGAMKHVAGVRQELKIRTVFNILGPLTNPAGADGQLMGVPTARLVEPIARVLGNLGVRHAFVVNGSDGIDELTLSGPSSVAETLDGKVATYEMRPELLGLTRAPKEALLGGDPAQNAAALRKVLQGDTGPHRDVVLYNAAPAIVAGKGAEDWQEGIEAARKSIDSGAALGKLEALIERSHDS